MNPKDKFLQKMTELILDFKDETGICINDVKLTYMKQDIDKYLLMDIDFSCSLNPVHFQN